METTRFAPSPTGRLHLGSAYSALFAEHQARQANGRLMFRIEDIDNSRCRPDYVAFLYEDLQWLGLEWEMPVRVQSEHFTTYAFYLDYLRERDLLYPCFCTRKDIEEEIARAPSAPHGPEGPLYPGTCRNLEHVERRARIEAGQSYALRLDSERAVSSVPALSWLDRARGMQTATPLLLGDVVLSRKEFPASYHLCVTVDDHLQGVTLVTRGQDLFHATHLHRLLQALLNHDTPEYLHHPLLLDETGRRLAKRDQSLTIDCLRRSGKTPADVRHMIQAMEAKVLL